MTGPIIIEFTVACDTAHAFDLWTAGIDRWWPSDHTVSGDPACEVVLEPRRGGRIFEREPDGTEHDWGEVLRCTPPTAVSFTPHGCPDARDRRDLARVEHPYAQRDTVPAPARRPDARSQAGQTTAGGTMPHSRWPGPHHARSDAAVRRTEQ